MNCIHILGCVLLPLFSYSQTGEEWIVEMDTGDGSFEAVGPHLENIGLVYGNYQCKDEENGHYVFVKTGGETSFVSVAISTSENIDETPIPFIFPQSFWGFHCYEGCDSLLVVCRDDQLQVNYVGLFDRYNGTEVTVISENLVDDDPDDIGISTLFHAYDPLNKELFLFSEHSATLRVMSIPGGEIVAEHTTSISPVLLAFDEINSRLYGLSFSEGESLQLSLYSPDLEDFIPIGEPFNSISTGLLTGTIDGNSNRMYVTRGAMLSNSYLISIDLETGGVLVDVETCTVDPWGSGEPNAINGQFFNSTGQLIALHWGSGESIVSTNSIEINSPKPIVYPNPSQGRITIDLNGISHTSCIVRVYNSTGQLVAEKEQLSKIGQMNLQLPCGFYVTEITDFSGQIISQRAPLILSR